MPLRRKEEGHVSLEPGGTMPAPWLLVPQFSHDFIALVALILKVIFKVNLFSA